MAVNKNIFQQTSPNPEKMITFNGKTLSIGDWARIKGIKKCTINNRINRGEPMENVLYSGNLAKFKKEQANG